MFDFIFLTDPATSSRPWEIVVAVLIIVITGVALFFLYRNVLFHFKKNKLEKDSMNVEKNKGEKNEKLLETVSRNPLLADINKDIAEIKEGDLRLFFAINLDNFRYIVDSYEQKDIDKVIDEYTKRLKKYCQKGSFCGHYDQDIFIYYYRGEINNEKIN